MKQAEVLTRVIHKRLVPALLPSLQVLHETQLSSVSGIEFILSKLSIFSARVSGASGGRPADSGFI